MWHSTSGISENGRKKMNIFKDIKLENYNSVETIFSIFKNSTF